jgi:hypothetical protein
MKIYLNNYNRHSLRRLALASKHVMYNTTKKVKNLEFGHKNETLRQLN